MVLAAKLKSVGPRVWRWGNSYDSDSESRQADDTL